MGASPPPRQRYFNPCPTLNPFLNSNNRLGNVGFIFTNDDLNKTRDLILAEKVAAPARAGAVAPADVFVPAGNTGMEPGKTSFFQALGVPTKIARGTIEITTDLKLVEAGTKVGASEATLLNMLNISPFTYGMSISQVYDNGQTFSPSVLDIKEDQLFAALNSAIKTITTISLAANHPTLPSIMHTLVNGYKKVLAVAVETDYSWEGIEELKDRIANPDAYASAEPAAATGGAAEAEKPAEDDAKKEDSEPEDSGDEGQCIANLDRASLTNAQVSVVCLTRYSSSILHANSTSKGSSAKNLTTIPSFCTHTSSTNLPARQPHPKPTPSITDEIMLHLQPVSPPLFSIRPSPPAPGARLIFFNPEISSLKRY